MRSPSLYLALSLFISIVSANSATPTPTPPPSRSQITLPFVTPLGSESPRLDLFRRQNNCPPAYNQCNNLGAPQACCPQSATCTPDNANKVACCPSGATCTGTLGGGSVSASGSGPFGGFVGATATVTGNTVTGAPYAWVIIPTSFPNQGVCSSYYTYCSTEYGKCTAQLGGGVNGVTVNAGNGGITVQGATATAAVASVCASISAVACQGLPLSYCSQLPQGGTNMADSKRAGIGGVFAGAVVGVLGGLL